MKKLIVPVLIGSLLVIFQNCGDTARTKTLFADEYGEYASSNCDQGICENAEQLLWLKIREYEPYKVSHSTTRNLGYFTVGGQCGTSNFATHRFVWEFRQGFGNQSVISKNFSEGRCQLGQFQVPIDVPSLQIVQNQRYQLTVELVGVDETGQIFSNPMPANKSTLDVIFIPNP